jgi:hypothetical protein
VASASRNVHVRSRMCSSVRGRSRSLTDEGCRTHFAKSSGEIRLTRGFRCDLIIAVALAGSVK